MAVQLKVVLSILVISCFIAGAEPQADACCAVSVAGKPVLNADQTVIILWDAANKTQHFIRQASFKSEADDFGFLVPSPSQPELEEAGDSAFPHLARLTEPQLPQGGGGMSCGCATLKAPPGEDRQALGVNVLQEKRVAGFNAVVLEANSATELAAWLKDNGYAFSPEVAAWAKPYVDAGWKITALKVLPRKEEVAEKQVKAAALRITFKTERPLFPYREPDYKTAAAGAKDRLLRIYFLAEARYQGELTKNTPWSGKVAWAGKLSDEDRTRLLDELKLPANTGPAQFWLTEFEDHWRYKLMPADVYFSHAATQRDVHRASTTLPVDATMFAFAAVAIVPPLWRRLRKRHEPRPKDIDRGS